MTYPRDMLGYGQHSLDPKWPNKAKVALQFVINYEEGGENCILHGDKASEAFLSEIVGAPALEGVRNMNMESIYEYGSRAGFWRLHRMFTERDMPVTVYGVATALQRNPEIVAAMNAADVTADRQRGGSARLGAAAAEKSATQRRQQVRRQRQQPRSATREQRPKRESSGARSSRVARGSSRRSQTAASREPATRGRAAADPWRRACGRGGGTRGGGRLA